MTQVRRIGRKDFMILSTGHLRRYRGSLFSLSVASTHGQRARSTVVVSKKVAARAVDRNLIKRRARAVIATELKKNDTPHAYLFYARKETLRAPYAHFVADITQLMNDARRGERAPR